jgi:hypothetical protein
MPLIVQQLKNSCHQSGSYPDNHKKWLTSALSALAGTMLPVLGAAMGRLAYIMQGSQGNAEQT